MMELLPVAFMSLLPFTLSEKFGKAALYLLAICAVGYMGASLPALGRVIRGAQLFGGG